MLKVTLKKGESLAIGGNITVELKQIATSRRATILIDAPREIPVKRQKAEDPPHGAYTGPGANRTGQQLPRPEAAGVPACQMEAVGASGR